MDHFARFLDRVLGLNVEPGDLSVLQMSARGLVVFVTSLAMFRLAHKRFFAQRNALDLLMTLVIASVLARAINGNAAFFPTIVVGFLLVAVHRVLCWLAVRSTSMGRLLKGHSGILIENGEVREAALRKHDLSRDDLDEDLRINGVASPGEVRRATLERNGEISVLKVKAL
jgi:uncharacterized membrane protein YcaP (DUF421 family)